MKILKKSLSVSPLLLLGTVSADTQEVSIVNGEYQTLTNPKDITVSPIEILGRGKHLRSHSNLSVRQWRGLYCYNCFGDNFKCVFTRGAGSNGAFQLVVLI